MFFPITRVRCTELTHGGAGEELHDAMLINHDHHIRDRIQDRAKVPLAVLTSSSRRFSWVMSIMTR